MDRPFFFPKAWSAALKQRFGVEVKDRDRGWDIENERRVTGPKMMGLGKGNGIL